MKKITLYTFGVLIATALMTGCKNGDNDFPSYEKGASVYFANQTPIRTLVMGEDTYDTSLDNAHKCQIQATMGGSRDPLDITLNIVVDESLCKNLFFDQAYTKPVLPMPTKYYTLSSNSMTFNGFRGAIDVQFTDDFFKDEKALEANYVIPVYIASQSGTARILAGETWPDVALPAQRTNETLWKVAPADYTLYCVKYICKYDAKYLRYGVDVITDGGNSKTITREKKAEPKDQEVKSDIKTLGLHKILYPVSVDGGKYTCDLEVTFNDNDEVTSVVSRTTGVTVNSFAGSYKEKSEKQAWGGKDRDGLYLDYKLTFASGAIVDTQDKLIVQTRGIVKEEFTPYYKN